MTELGAAPWSSCCVGRLGSSNVDSDGELVEGSQSEIVKDNLSKRRTDEGDPSEAAHLRYLWFVLLQQLRAPRGGCCSSSSCNGDVSTWRAGIIAGCREIQFRFKDSWLIFVCFTSKVGESDVSFSPREHMNKTQGGTSLLFLWILTGLMLYWIRTIIHCDVSGGVFWFIGDWNWKLLRNTTYNSSLMSEWLSEGGWLGSRPLTCDTDDCQYVVGPSVLPVSCRAQDTAAVIRG